MQFSVRVFSPRQHCEGALHFLVATAVPFCPQGPVQAPGVHEDQPASPEQEITYRQCVHVDWAVGYAHITGKSDGSHGHSAQMSVLLDFPSQSLPPLAGAGLLHILISCRVPPPQVALQGATSFQDDQPPSIATIKYI